MKRTLYLIGMTIAGLTLSACHSNHSKTPSTQVAASQSVETTDTLPDMRIANSQRDKVSTAQEIKRHTLTIIDFWASWCGPCMAEMPHLVALHEAYAAKGLGIIGISLDNDYNAWQAAIESQGMAWLQLSELRGWDTEAAQTNGVHSIPHTIIVDNNARILATGLRGDALKQFIEKKLGE